MRSLVKVMALAALLAAPAAAAQEAVGEQTASGDRRFDAEHFHAADLDHVRYTVYPGMSAVNTTSPSLSNLKGTLHEVDARFLYPIVLDRGRTSLAIGLQYTFTYYKLTGVTESTQPTSMPNAQVKVDAVPTTLQAVAMPFGIHQRLAPRWSATVGGIVGMYSDFRSFDLGAVSLQGGATFTYTHSPAFSVGFGLAYQSKFGQALLLPALQIDWYMGAGFRFRASAPDDAHFYFVPHDRIVLQLGAHVSGGAYRIHPNATLVTTSTNMVQSQVPVTFSYDLAYSTIAADVGAKVRLWDGLYLSAEAPLAIKRRWEASNTCWTTGDGKQQCVNGPESVDLANVKKLSLGAQVGLEYRY